MLREIITPYVIWGVILFVSSVAAGIPDIIVQITHRDFGLSNSIGQATGSQGYVGHGANVERDQYTWRASYVNDTYGHSTTVTPLSLSTKFFIKY